MAPSLKLSLLALVGAAAAVPGHGHDKFHKRHNYPMTNSTTSIAADVPADAATTPLPAIATHVYLNTSSVADAQMTSSGAAHVSSAAADAAAGTSMYPNEAAGSASKANAAPADATAGSSAGAAGGASSDSTTTQTSTKTRTQTVTMKKPQGTGAAAQPSPPALNADVPSNNDVADNAQCGPETVTVTAVEKVTVTVQPNVQPNSKKPNRKTTVVYVTAEPATSGAAAISEGSPAPSEAPAQSPVNTKPAVESPAPAVTPTDGGKPPAAPTGVSGSSAAVETSAGAGYPALSSQASESEVATPTASSSAAPKPSSPSTGTKGKRGLVYAWNEGSEAQKLAEAHDYDFCYSWEPMTKYPDEGKNEPVACPFIATLKDKAAEQAFNAGGQAQLALDRGGPKVLFSYNEPDQPTSAGGAQMSVQEVCNGWTANMRPLIKKNPGLDAVAPSVCNADTTNGQNPGMGLNFYRDMQKTCSDVFDEATSINLHYYYNGPSPDGPLKHFQNHYKQAEEFGKPIWITELGVLRGVLTEEETAEFMKAAISWADGQANCKGVSWFAAGSGGDHFGLGTVENPSSLLSTYTSI